MHDMCTQELYVGFPYRLYGLRFCLHCLVPEVSSCFISVDSEGLSVSALLLVASLSSSPYLFPITRSLLLSLFYFQFAL